MRYSKAIYVEVKADSIEEADRAIALAISGVDGFPGITEVDTSADAVCVDDED